MLLQMMRCDVTKFNKRFGICKVRLLRRSYATRPSLPPLIAGRHPRAASPLQMNAKAFVGEDVVCEAELTLVMGK
jgi:hypothetical protein